MRVLHVISGLDPRAGGPAQALAGLASAQAEAGLHVTILSSWREGWNQTMAKRFENDERIDLRLVGPIAGWRKTHPDVSRVAHEETARADIVHIHALWETIQLAASRSARQHGKPVIFRPCGMLDPWSMAQGSSGGGGWKKRLYLNFVLRRELNAAALLHYTTQTEADLAAKWKLSTQPIIVPNGLELPEFRNLPERGAFRQKHDIPADTPLALFMSRVHPKKGIDLLIPAFAHVAKENPDALLVIAGPPYLDTRLHMEELAHQCGIADRVLFVGMLTGTERLEALADADLFVLPSRQENFGLVVAEAMAAGRPVIVTDQVNIHTEITACGAGAVIPLNVNSLAEAMTEWFADPDKCRAAGRRGHQYAHDTWDWSVIAQQWATTYEDISRPTAS